METTSPGYLEYLDLGGLPKAERCAGAEASEEPGYGELGDGSTESQQRGGERGVGAREGVPGWARATCKGLAGQGTSELGPEGRLGNKPVIKGTKRESTIRSERTPAQVSGVWGGAGGGAWRGCPRGSGQCCAFNEAVPFYF